MAQKPSEISNTSPRNVFGDAPLLPPKEWEEAQTNLALWSTLPIFLVSLVIIGGYSASAGLVFMIAMFTALAIYFAFNKQ